MSSILEDLRHAGRVFAARPGYLATAVLTLAIGIAFSTATFTVVNAVLLRPLPYAQPDRLVRLMERDMPRFPQFSVSPGDYLFWRDNASAFEGIAAWASQSVNLEVDGGDPERVRADKVTANLFPVLGVSPALGRGFTAADDRDGAPLTVMLSWGAWQRRFGGRADAIGRPVAMDRVPATVIGVMPPGFTFNAVDTEMWVPMQFTPAERHTYGSHFLTAVARLKPGVTIDAAGRDLDRVSRELARVNPGSAGWDVLIFDLRDSIVGKVKPMLMLLFGAVTLVLLIGCANVANLLLVRGASRQKELAIRAAIGASRVQLLRQLLIEQLALAAISAAVGVLAAAWLVRLLLAILPRALPRQEAIAIDGWVLGFAVLLSVLTPLFFGLLPALYASRPDLRHILSLGGRSGAAAPARRMRAAIVVAEVALATMLLVGTGLLARSFARLVDVPPGFDPSGALLTGVSLPADTYPEGEPRERFFAAFLARAEALGQVAAVGLSMPMPMVADYNSGFEIEGQPTPPEGRPLTLFYAVSPGFFPAMRIPLIRGRLITAEDTRASRRVIVINQVIADQYFPGLDPIGHRMRVGQGGDAWREIVGVVGNVKHFGLADPSTAQVYESFLQHPYFSTFSVVVRTRGEDPAALVPQLRAILHGMDPDLPLARVRLMQDLVDGTVRPQRFSTTLISLFGVAALLLAVIGIYSVMASTVGLRTQEFAIRIAHGASRADISRLVLRGALTMSAGGLACGLAAAWLLRRSVSALLFEVTPSDTVTYAAVAATLLAAALIATAVPTLRATRVDPIVALRRE